MKSIRCDISDINQIDEDVLLINILPDHDFELNDLNQLYDAVEEIGKGKKFYNIINVGEFTSPSHPVRLIVSSKERANQKKADAFIIRTMPQKLIANFYMSFYKPESPTKFFNSVEEAKKWIYLLKSKEKINKEKTD